jgi:YidC/Oxa1 family membrane protein insertase
MDRTSLLRIALIAVALLLFFEVGVPAIFGKGGSAGQKGVPFERYVNAPGYVGDPVDYSDSTPHPEEGTLCKIAGNRFDAVFSTRGASLLHFFLRDPQYAGTDGYDIATTGGNAVERWRSLRTLFRGEKGTDQLKYDRFDWKLETAGGASCTFTYSDPDVSITKTVSAGERPFELNVDTSLTNNDDAPKRHQFSIEAFAYLQNKDLKGDKGDKGSGWVPKFLKRPSPFVTELSCARGTEVTRKNKDDFKDGWFSEPLVDRYAAVSNYYFAQAIVPVEASSGEKPECQLLAEDWFGEKQRREDDDAGAIYHARLVFPGQELAPKATATYKQIAFFGPKERDVLARAAGGGPKLGDLINLGYFSPVAKVLVGVLVFFHAHVTFGSWGLAIIAMTICLRVLLLPLSIKPVKTAIAMRRLKPEMDAVAAKFKDDAQAKNMAMMELYRKHGVNPLGGCLPQLVQMPIWFAMYTTLQTAVEMYHEKFLWFTDLSAPDKMFILPLVLGAFMILQQRIVPQQGMDPVQAKMMMYLLPGVFTVMMLFLPAALGVYMLTNSVLGITQQLVVEKIAPRGGGKSAKGEIAVRQGKDDKSNDAPLSGAFGKGKARV